MQKRNEVILEGNFCRDSESKFTKNGKIIATNSLAYNESYKKGDEFVKVTHYFDITSFGAVAEKLVQFKKGDAVRVEGSLKQDRWDDPEGKKRSKVYVVAWKIEPMETATKPQGNTHIEKKDQGDGFQDDDFSDSNPPF